MDMPPEVRVTTRLQRKDPGLPVYVVIPGRHLRPWGLAGTTVVEGSANGRALGRRTIKAWGKGSDDWFVELTAPFCRTACLTVGDRVVLALRLADASVPEELQRELSQDRRVASAWRALSERGRRDAGERIRAARTAATRQRRAAAIAEHLRARAKA
jgi:hypothetical protein